MKERVTVCLCAYNHEAYVRDALDSLAEQTFREFKIVACDDGSTDATHGILTEYEAGKLSGRLKVVTHPGRVNAGIHRSVNLCLSYADTEFFMMQASDDFLEPDALEYLLGLLGNDTSADFLYGQVNVVDEHGADLFRFDGTEDIGSGLTAAERLLLGNPVRAPSMFFRASCKKYLQEVPGDLIYGDWYHNVLLFLEKNPLYYRRAVVNYRRHSTNTSIGTSEELSHKRQLEVVSALFANPSVVVIIALRCMLLTCLYTNNRTPLPKADVREEIAAFLNSGSNQSSRKLMLKKIWRASQNPIRRGTSSLLDILPWRDRMTIISYATEAAAVSCLERCVRKAHAVFTGRFKSS